MFLAGAIGCFLDNTVPGKYSLYWTSTTFRYKVMHSYFSHRKLFPFLNDLGTDEERGILKWQSQFNDGEHDDKIDGDTEKNACYDFPIGMNIVRR